MPIYEYQCANCGHQLEELQSITEPPLEKCPKCGKNTLKRLIGAGAGLIFKGSGFYLTDYKRKSTSGNSAPRKKEKPKAETPAKSAESKKKD
jgi:putative FmdB family regulatory protein